MASDTKANGRTEGSYALPMHAAGQHLRMIREKLGFRLRDVESVCARIAEQLNSPDYTLPVSTLSDIETKGAVPTVFRLFALSMVYRTSPDEIFRLFGIPLDQFAQLDIPSPPNTATVEVRKNLQVELPILDPGFDVRHTAEVGRFVQQWGMMPMSFLKHFREEQYLYGYIGLEDFTMYPLLLPGTFVQIDPAQTAIANGPWPSEHERPLFFLETREGNLCGWCNLVNGVLTLQGHPLSGVNPQQLRTDRDVNVLGRVIGIAMRLGVVPKSPFRARL